MEKLKVNDKVYLKTYQRYGNNVYYQFATVERLTKTQAILSNGKKLINEPVYDGYYKIYGYGEYGNRWTKWYIQTDGILKEAEKEKNRQKKIAWFNNAKFDEEQKFLIYDYFESINKLQPPTHD